MQGHHGPPAEWIEQWILMAPEHVINGQTLHLKAESDVRVAQRVTQHMQRRMNENDWRPYSSKEQALQAWIRLGGIRLQVMKALGLV